MSVKPGEAYLTRFTHITKSTTISQQKSHNEISWKLSSLSVQNNALQALNSCIPHGGTTQRPKHSGRRASNSKHTVFVEHGSTGSAF